MKDVQLMTTNEMPRRAGRLERLATVLVLVAVSGVALAPSSASSQSLTDRFKSLFGGKSEPAPQTSSDAAAAPADDVGDLTCPEVAIRAGASTYAVGLPGKEASGTDLRYQATIVRTARECSLNNGQITAHIGIMGRVIAGPAGAPSEVEVPMRVAVVQGGIQEKTIFTKAYRTQVGVATDDSAPFTLVADDIVYPAPKGAVADSYVFYIGFDPQALKPEPRAKTRSRKKK